MKTERAIVIGGSMAGLLAARVLSECFQEVVVLERDRLPCGAAHRKGAPQSRHVHVLLARGLEVFEELFSGLTEELIEGSVPVSAPEQHLYWIAGGYYCPIDYPHRGVHPSRPLLEAAVRSRVFARPNVRLLDGISVVAFVASGNRERIHGVHCSHSESDDRATEDTLEADLVIDATGRGSHTPAWLEGMGYPRPREERIDVGMGYATRHYRREPGQLDGKHFVALSATPTCRRGAIASAQEGDRWIVTLAGYPGDHPPTDEAGFVAFAATLAAPDVHDLISRAKPIDDPTPARYPASQHRHYEELSCFPEGLVVFGDAHCSFNPVYGQGMTVAALQAVALRQCLVAGLERLAPRFFRLAARTVAAPWSLAGGSDRQMLKPKSTRPLPARMLEWYIGKLHVAARFDPFAAAAFVKVIGLDDPPSSLLRPRVVAHVLRGSLQHRVSNELNRVGRG